MQKMQEAYFERKAYPQAPEKLWHLLYACVKLCAQNESSLKQRLCLRLVCSREHDAKGKY